MFKPCGSFVYQSIWLPIHYSLSVIVCISVTLIFSVIYMPNKIIKYDTINVTALASNLACCKSLIYHEYKPHWDL